MNKMHFVLLLIATTVLTACDGNLSQQPPQFLKDLNSEIMNDIRKSFPLPEPTLINDANGNVVHYTTTLSVEKVVAFYRQAYGQHGGAEMPEEASVSIDSGQLAFHTSGGDTVHIQIKKEDSETKVTLHKK